MSKLHNQFDDARKQYLSGKYPGDLADDVLNASYRMLVIRRIAAATMALAAMLLVVWAIWPDSRTGGTTPTINTPQVAVATPSEDGTQTYSLTGGEVPDMTDQGGTSMVPAYGSLTISQVPAMTDVTRDDATTSSELETRL